MLAGASSFINNIVNMSGAMVSGSSLTGLDSRECNRTWNITGNELDGANADAAGAAIRLETASPCISGSEGNTIARWARGIHAEALETRAWRFNTATDLRQLHLRHP